MVNLHLFLSDISNESRLEKEIYTLRKLKKFDEFIVIGFTKDLSTTEKKLGDDTKIILFSIHHRKTFSFIANKILNAIAIVQYFVNVFLKMIKIRPDTISIHNPIFLPVAVLSSLINGGKLVYVPHELEYHKTGLSFAFKCIVFIIEFIFVRFCKSVITVNENISGWYKKHYSCQNIFEVPNIPLNPSKEFNSNIFREKFKIPNDRIIFLYQGVLSPFRGVDDLISVFSSEKIQHHIVFMGYGEYEVQTKLASKKYENIHFQEAVKPDEILTYTSSADVGVFFNSKKISLSYRWSLPNKFYEYSLAGLTLLMSSNFEIQSKLIKTYELGRVINPSIEALQKTVENLRKENLSISEKSLSYRKNICWSQNDDTYDLAYS